MSDEKKHTYQSDTLGLPPLQMVLVNAENERANRTQRTLPKPRLKNKEDQARAETILRLIENLEKK